MNLGGRTGDKLCGAIGLLAGLFYLSQGIHLPIWTSGGNPGAGFLPMGLGIAFVVLSLMLMLKAWSAQHTVEREESKVDWQTIAKPLLVFCALFAYIVLFPILGYLLTSVALIGFLLWAFDSGSAGLRKMIKTTALSVTVVVAFYVIFVQLLKLQLPAWPFSA